MMPNRTAAVFELKVTVTTGDFGSGFYNNATQLDIKNTVEFLSSFSIVHDDERSVGLASGVLRLREILRRIPLFVFTTPGLKMRHKRTIEQNHLKILALKMLSLC